MSEMVQISRRYFFFGIFGAAISCRRAAQSIGNRVSVVRAKSYSSDLEGIVRRILIEHRVPIAGKKVLLKPNLVEFSSNAPINTHPAFVAAVAAAFRSLDAEEVRIAEGPGHRRTTLDLAWSAGYFDVTPNFESEFTDLNLDDVSRIPIRNPEIRLGTISSMVTLYKRGTTWWIKGRLPDGRPVPRQSTRQRDQAAAERVRDWLIKSYTPSSPVHGITIQDALDTYLRTKTLAERTHEQYRRVIAQLPAVYMGDLTAALIDAHLAQCANEATSRRVYRNKIAAFLRDAWRRGWISEPLADKIARIEAHYEQARPFSDSEINSILNWRGNTGKWDGDTFRLLLELMVRTGMRVGDALLFDSSKVRNGVYRFSPMKQKRAGRQKWVDSFIPPDLLERIGSRSFRYSRGQVRYLADKVAAVMGRMGIDDCRPHRLRDTFAVRCLERGLTIDEVKELLGHSSVSVTEQYYAYWSRARQDRLRERVSKVSFLVERAD